MCVYLAICAIACYLAVSRLSCLLTLHVHVSVQGCSLCMGIGYVGGCVSACMWGCAPCAYM